MKSYRYSLVVVCLLLSVWPAEGASLIYALSYQETAASIPAHRTYNILTAIVPQKLMMVRNYSKTEICAVSMADGTRTVVFSDEGPYFEITTLQGGDQLMVLAGSKAYVKGVEREWRGMPHPGVYSTPPAIYELALDGSNRFRKIFETRENTSSLCVNSSGTKLGYMSSINGKYIMSIYDVATGVLLRTWDAQKLFQDHCPDCNDESTGWLADGERLFVTMRLGDQDSISPQSHNEEGTYIVSEAGKDLGSIPPDMGRVQLPGYRRKNSTPPTFLGQTPDGQYIFKDFAFKRDPRSQPPAQAQSFIVIANPQTKTQRQLLLQTLSSSSAHVLYLSLVRLSPSGRFAAFLEERLLKNYQSEKRVWGEDLQSRDRKELFMLPARTPPSSEPNVFLNILGWVDER